MLPLSPYAAAVSLRHCYRPTPLIYPNAAAISLRSCYCPSSPIYTPMLPLSPYAAAIALRHRYARIRRLALKGRRVLRATDVVLLHRPKLSCARHSRLLSGRLSARGSALLHLWAHLPTTAAVLPNEEARLSVLVCPAHVHHSPTTCSHPELAPAAAAACAVWSPLPALRTTPSVSPNSRGPAQLSSAKCCLGSSVT